jgi:methionyl-tRNA formyltransferase
MSAPARLRVLLFGSGGLLSASALRALAAEHDVLGVVLAKPARPWERARRLLGAVARSAGLRRGDVLMTTARSLGVRLLPLPSVQDDRLAESIAALRLDLLCVAHFPWRIPDRLIASARLGGVNLHPSLLPRHRGPLPLCWVYHGDDRETGVTVHHLTKEMDAGNIVAQRAFPLPRGYPVDRLNADNARVGAEVLQEAMRALAAGAATGRPQDHTRATRAPFVRPGQRLVEFDTWDAERVWHFLAGVWPRFIEPLQDVEGRAASYGGVLGYDRTAAGLPPGRVRTADGDRLALSAVDGTVWLRTG